MRNASVRENHPTREKATRGGEREKSLPAACRLFSRGVTFTRARVSHALLSLRKNGGLLVVYTHVPLKALIGLVQSLNSDAKAFKPVNSM